MEDDLKLVYSSSNEHDILLAISILKDNNINFIRKDSGSGSYMNIYMGQSIQEKTLYVNTNDYYKALDLLNTIIGDENISNYDNEELMEEENDSKYSKKITNIKRILVFLVLGLPILTILISIIIISLLY